MTAATDHDVFLFDLDGTLAHDGGDLEPANARALGRIIGLGKHVGIVTSRGPDEIKDLPRSLARHIEPQALAARVTLFPSTGALAYRPRFAPEPALELVWSFVEAEDVELLSSLGEKWSRSVRVLSRGPQLTILDADAGASFRIERLLRRHEARLRCVRVAPTCWHVLPVRVGKHTALDYYRGLLGELPSVAVGDGFHEMWEIDVRGNDVDWVGRATTCIQVGLIRPRDPRVLYLPLGHDGPDSVVRVVDALFTMSRDDLARLPAVPRAALAALEYGLLEWTAAPEVKSFVNALVDYTASALAPSDFERRCAATARLLREGGAPRLVFEQLARGSPLEHGFARWAGFEGNLKGALQWLRDEHLARPAVAISEHMKDRVRAPLLPEELAIALVRTLPAVHRGDQVVLIGKDAECGLPVLEELVRRGREALLLPPEVLSPLGLKVSARKSSRPGAIDGLEHLALGSVARQLSGMLCASEQDARLPAVVRRRFLEAARALSPAERADVERALGNKCDIATSELALGEVVARVADARVEPRLEAFAALCREVVYDVQAALARVRSGATTSVDALLTKHAANLAEHSSSIARRYREKLGRDDVASAEDTAVLNALLFELVGTQYSELRDLEFPYTGLLRATMSETEIRRTLNRRVLYVDASCNSGMTVLFLRALRKIVAPEGEFRFAALGGVVLHEPLKADLEWCGHAHLPVLLDEGAPHTFGFFYDDGDARRSYDFVLASLEDGSGTAADASHIDGICTENAALLATFDDLEAEGVDLRDIVRWWLRRDRIWEMRVLSDRIRFRWPHAQTVRLQRRAVELVEGLDACVGAASRARLAGHDRVLYARETRTVLEEWLRRGVEWNGRAFAMARSVMDCSTTLREYLATPSPDSWRAFQRDTMRAFQQEQEDEPRDSATRNQSHAAFTSYVLASE